MPYIVYKGLIYDGNEYFVFLEYKNGVYRPGFIHISRAYRAQIHPLGGPFVTLYTVDDGDIPDNTIPVAEVVCQNIQIIGKAYKINVDGKFMITESLIEALEYCKTEARNPEILYMEYKRVEKELSKEIS
ncbi:MAG: hypothetical protein GXO68_05665 [Crenarchaeota archaeon]|nr:hypothetical protein [Thermoproteota archaeon]